jgi:hypothetical protein
LRECIIDFSGTNLFTPQGIEKAEPGTSRNLTCKSLGLEEIHALEVGIVGGEDFVGFWNDPYFGV